MKTRIINHAQGTEAWHKHRALHLNASDAAALLGLSSYKTRTKLLHEKATGLTDEVDASTQRRFAKGHEFEATARPWAEEIIGSDLFPAVLAGEYEGLKLSASLDGVDMASDFTFEHKSGRADLLARLDDDVIPAEYHPQMEMGLMLSGASKCLFMASSGDKDAMRCAWYLPNIQLRAQIIAAWHQFKADLAAYVPPIVKPEAIGHTPETLPALHIEVNGMVTASNLADYKAHALAVFGGINRDLKTEQQFADAEKVVKWCADVEDRLAAAKQHALSQTKSIDDLFRAIDDISAEARRTRLEIDKLVRSRKEAVRHEIVARGVAVLYEHSQALNAGLGGTFLPSSRVSFFSDCAAAIKNKRTIESLNDAVDTLLASEKIKADGIADNIRKNLAALDGLSKGFEFLINDRAVLVLKAPDDMAAVVKSRIADYQAMQAHKQVVAEAAAAAMPAILATIVQPASVPVPAPVQDDGRRIRLGELSECFGISVTADFLQHLGFAPVAIEKNSKFYRAADFDAIRAAFVRHVQGAVLVQLVAI